MTVVTGRSRRDGSLIVGGGLILLGLLALLATSAGLDPTRWLDGSGWTLFVIVHGIVLLAAGLLTTRPAAEGMTIAGAIVTTLGLMLLAMDRLDNWEASAYVWALIPMAAGVGLVLHGLRTGRSALVGTGVRLALIASLMLVVGAWYFGAIFSTGGPPIDLAIGWPVVLIVIGVVVVVAGLIRGPGDSRMRDAH